MFRWPSTLDASAILSANSTSPTPELRRAFAAELVLHLRKHGFARVRNHGVTPAVVRDLFKYVRMYGCGRDDTSSWSDLFFRKPTARLNL